MTKINPSSLFEDAAEAGAATTVYLDRPFDIAPDGGLTYSIEQLTDLVVDAAGWLAAAGAGPGDRVAILKDNHWDSDLLAYAAIRIGAVPAKIRSDLPPAATELVLRRLEPAVLLSTAGALEAGHRAGIDLAALAMTTVTIDQPAAGALTLESVSGQAPPPRHSRDDGDPLIICPTSGTTGVPKLAIHSTATIIRALAEFEATPIPFFGCRRSDTVASASAFSHGRTFCWTAVLMAMRPSRVVIVSDHDPARSETLLRAHRPTIFEALPATFIRWQPMTAGAENPFREVRLYVSTYDAIHPPAVRAFLAASQQPRVVFMHGWGQTETGPLTFRLFTRQALASTGELSPTTRNQGKATPIKTRLRVVDPTTFHWLPHGEAGVIMAKTKALCLGYVGEQQRFEDKADGAWFNTGDIGKITRTGDVIFVDREVDVIPGMSCVELEDIIDDRLAEVLECIVIGAPGQLPLPVVVTADGSLNRAAWNHAVADLPPLGEPLVRTWDEIPRTGTGKVRRLQLRESLTDLAATFGSGDWT